MDLSALDLILSVFLAFIGVIVAGYGFLRFLVKPMVSEEIEKTRDWFLKISEKEHSRIERDLDRERLERVAQYKDVGENLAYIRDRLDKLVEKLIPAVS